MSFSKVYKKTNLIKLWENLLSVILTLCRKSEKLRLITLMVEMVGRLIIYSIDRNLTSNCFDNRLINYVIFQVKMGRILWLQLLQCENLLLYSILYDSKLNISGFWTTCLTAEPQWWPYCIALSEPTSLRIKPDNPVFVSETVEHFIRRITFCLALLTAVFWSPWLLFDAAFPLLCVWERDRECVCVISMCLLTARRYHLGLKSPPSCCWGSWLATIINLQQVAENSEWHANLSWCPSGASVLTAGENEAMLLQTLSLFLSWA